MHEVLLFNSEYLIRVQGPKAVEMQYKIMNRNSFKAYWRLSDDKRRYMPGNVQYKNIYI